MRRFGFIGLLVTLLIAGVAGTIGYNAGYSAGVVNGAAANGASVVYAGGGWGGGGFGFFGLIFGLLFLFFIFGLVRRAAFGWGGGPRGHAMHGYARGGWGKGPWSGGTGAEHSATGNPGVPPFVDGMLQDWHRQAHDQARGNPEASPPSSGGTSPA